MLYYVVCYDIADDLRRNRVARRLQGWGLRVQYSVFEVVCRSTADLRRLSDELHELAQAEDSIRLYHFTDATRARSGELDGQAMRVCPAAVVI